MNKDTVIKAIISAIGGFAGFYIGGFDNGMKVLFSLMITDYITGILTAYFGVSKKGVKLNSKTGLLGITKKLFILLLVATAFQIDTLFGTEKWRAIALYALATNEAISILENAVCIGIWIPDALKKGLEILKDSYNKTNGEVKEP